MTDAALLSLVVFLPALSAGAIVAFDGENRGAIRRFANLTTLAVVGLLFGLVLPRYLAQSPDEAGYRLVVDLPWVPGWGIGYRLGLDGLSLPLLLLTGVVSHLAMWASAGITKQTKGYLILFLLLETGMLGSFVALDFLLFYVFFEVMLLPMYFLIGLWGGPRKEYAAIKFFLYTLVGSVLMLIVMLMAYAGSSGVAGGATFDLPTLTAIGSGRVDTVEFSGKVQCWAFAMLLIAFLIKLPAVPFHTWLPDAHVEAPTPVSMILAGVLLKVGGYGLLRIAYPLFPLGAAYFADVVVWLGVVSILYGAFVALAQTDFKRLVAYSSVSHMGYVLLGIGIWSPAAADTAAWQMGMNGAVFQMIGHGITSVGMFFLVGVLYDRVKHRDMREMGGLLTVMPRYGGLSIGIFFAAMGLPGLCGFWGEVFPVLAAWSFSPWATVLAATGVILTAGYMLFAVQRIYLGPRYIGPRGEQLVPMTASEKWIAGLVMTAAVVFGVYPRPVFDVAGPAVARITADAQTGVETAEVRKVARAENEATQ
ncbi:MAG: NADH-quinone oxidoreductase subunit M [Planctomycetota bacterium]